MKRTVTTVTWTAATMLLVTTMVGGCDSGGGSSSTTSPTPSGFGSTSPNPSASALAATVSTRPVSQLGTILVDGHGRTLYLFRADTSNRSTCFGTCAAIWPPMLTSGGVKAAKGARSNLLGTTKRSGGSAEVTYNGHPLYYFAGDSMSGDTNGQGLNQFGALWYVLSPAGDEIVTG